MLTGLLTGQANLSRPIYWGHILFWKQREVISIFLARGAKEKFKFHHISTDEVYGELPLNDEKFDETTPYAPSSPYSASKAASDHLVLAWYHTYGLPVVLSNCSNNYGPYQFPEKLIPLMIINCMKGKLLPVYGRGENVRDWLHVDDHAAALLLVATSGRVGRNL